jgi:hypothetical protein
LYSSCIPSPFCLVVVVVVVVDVVVDVIIVFVVYVHKSRQPEGTELIITG